VRVVPVFLGQGAHLRRDLPALAAAAGARHPGLEIALEPAIGEQPAVIAALAAAIGRG
jgi:sirohydrochlorin cobaltochelatase